MKRFVLAAIALPLILLSLLAFAQQPTPAIPPLPKQSAPLKHGTGLVLPPLNVRVANHQADLRRHAIHQAKLLMRLTTPLPASYDCRMATVGGGTANLCTAVKDQGQCGDCWLHSCVESDESCNILRGNLLVTQPLSVQYALDGCAFSNGGCGGDDASNGFGWLKSGGGFPLASAYAPYSAYSQNCSLSTTAAGYGISDWGYVSSSAGIPSADLMKAAILQYGPISVCIAADSALENFSGNGVFTDTGYGQINHQVVAAGWDDAKGASVGAVTAFLLRNSWGNSWANNGYCFIAAGANQFGTEAMWVTAGTPVVLQPCSNPQPNPPQPSPTRRMVLVAADLVQQYQEGSDQDKAQVLSLLDQAEKAAKGYKAKRQTQHK